MTPATIGTHQQGRENAKQAYATQYGLHSLGRRPAKPTPAEYSNGWPPTTHFCNAQIVFSIPLCERPLDRAPSARTEHPSVIKRITLMAMKMVTAGALTHESSRTTGTAESSRGPASRARSPG